MAFDKLLVCGVEGELVRLVVEVERLLGVGGATQPRQVEMFVGGRQERGEGCGHPRLCCDQQSDVHHQSSHFCFVYLIF